MDRAPPLSLMVSIDHRLILVIAGYIMTFTGNLTRTGSNTFSPRLTQD